MKYDNNDPNRPVDLSMDPDNPNMVTYEDETNSKNKSDDTKPAKIRQYVAPQISANMPEGQKPLVQQVVYQGNPLVERKNNFNTIETKLFYLGLTQISPKIPKAKYFDEDFFRVLIPIKDVIEMFGGYNSYYGELHKAVNNLAGKYISIKTKKGFENYPIFAFLKWNKDTGLLLEFNRYMSPFLLELANRSYTRIEFEQIWKLTSIYAIRILELILQYRSLGERTLTFEDLRTYLGIDADMYKNRVDNFKKYVIELPVKEINEKTHFNIIYTYKKTGRVVTSVKFHIIDKSQILDCVIESQKVWSETVVKDLVKQGVALGMANTLVKKFGNNYCADNANYVIEKYGEKAKNLAGYIVKGIKGNYYGENQKKLNKEVIELWPSLEKDDIIALKELAEKGDKLASRRLDIYYEELNKNEGHF